MRKTPFAIIISISALGVAGATGLGCSSDPKALDDEVVDITTDGIEPKSSQITYDGWTGTAFTPTGNSCAVQGQATFVRTSGPTVRGAGLCVLKRYGAGTACNTEADCSLPAGGVEKYCEKPDGETTKQCYWRGSVTSWCAGSPATGSPIAPGTYTKWVTSPGIGKYITKACMDNCAPGGISVSSAGQAYHEYCGGGKK